MPNRGWSCNDGSTAHVYNTNKKSFYLHRDIFTGFSPGNPGDRTRMGEVHEGVV